MALVPSRGANNNKRDPVRKSSQGLAHPVLGTFRFCSHPYQYGTYAIPALAEGFNAMTRTDMVPI
eukprot:scaffold137096_cov18-Tisochrysis_lutea.AAC.1